MPSSMQLLKSHAEWMWVSEVHKLFLVQPDSVCISFLISFPSVLLVSHLFLPVIVSCTLSSYSFQLLLSTPISALSWSTLLSNTHAVSFWFLPHQSMFLSSIFFVPLLPHCCVHGWIPNQDLSPHGCFGSTGAVGYIEAVVIQNGRQMRGHSSPLSHFLCLSSGLR